MKTAEVINRISTREKRRRVSPRSKPLDRFDFLAAGDGGRRSQRLRRGVFLQPVNGCVAQGDLTPSMCMLERPGCFGR